MILSVNLKQRKNCVFICYVCIYIYICVYILLTIYIYIYIYIYIEQIQELVNKKHKD